MVKYFVCPTENEIKNIKEVGSIDNKHKIVDVSIIMDEDNFFSKNESERQAFLLSSLLEALYLLSEKIEFYDIDKLISDIKKSY